LKFYRKIDGEFMEIRKTEPVMNVIDAEFKEIIQILCIDKNQGNDENIYRVEVY